MTGLTARETRVLNPRPRRHHRPTYSRIEVRLGLAVLVLLAAIGGWVAWRGAHPDPELFADPAQMLDPGQAAVDRGALPPDLAAPGWAEGPLSRFDAANLYEKINGRADFFLSRGFESLTFVSLTATGESVGPAVDVEFFDLGSDAGARSAFGSERPPEVTESGDGWYRARNAVFLARGCHYVRAIGSDESAAVVTQLDHLRQALEAALAASERPWDQALFAEALGVPADRVGLLLENAFSFGFARNVHTALLDDETEAFVVATTDAAAAQSLAAQFESGFLGYGDRAEHGGRTWIKDRYLEALSIAAAEGPFVVGLRGAADPATAASTLERLRSAVAALDPGVAREAAAMATNTEPTEYP